jgi:hypothetical protein
MYADGGGDAHYADAICKHYNIITTAATSGGSAKPLTRGCLGNIAVKRYGLVSRSMQVYMARKFTAKSISRAVLRQNLARPSCTLTDSHCDTVALYSTIGGL